MSILRFFRNPLQKSTARRSKLRSSLQVETLESRLVPYSVSGNAWMHPELITISFVPDGTNLGGSVTSNLFSTFNAKFGSAAAWQNQFLKAAQVWAQQTNLNFAVVSDNGTAIGAGSYEQGDPNMGDIRIGGYNFGNTNLAQAFMPPQANNYSIAGDMQFNTAQTFNIGSTYDLLTVAVHEFGHALGLYHSDTYTAAMYGAYGGTKTALTSDDIAGIQSIYSNNQPRSKDQYNSGAADNSMGAATSVQIDSSSLTALVAHAEIATTGQKEYYAFTAPSGTNGTLKVQVQSNGLSLLAPKASVLNAAGSTLTAVSGYGRYGTTLTLTVSGVTAGSTYYLLVQGADSSALGTGAYAFTLDFGNGSSPTVPLPNTETLNGTPLSGGGGQAIQTAQELQVNSFTTNAQQTFAPNQRSVAMASDGSHVATWSSYGQDGSGWGVFAQRYDSQGNRLGSEFQVNVTTAGDQMESSIASAANGNFIITWAGRSQSGSPWEIYARRYNNAGAALGGEFRISTAWFGDQLYPNVAIAGNGTFVITWSGRASDGSWDVYAQRYDGNGWAMGGNFRVNSTTAGDQMYSAVAMDLLGDWTIVWQSYGQDGSGWGIYGQRYEALPLLGLSLPLLGEFQVNNTSAGDQEFPSISMAPLGNFVVTWSSNGQDGSGWGVYAQQFSLLSLLPEGEFRVNTTTLGDQMYSSASMSDNSNFLITWTSSPPGASSGDIYGQQYLSPGVALGHEFQINTTSGGKNYATAALSDSRAVVVWSGSGAGVTQGVFGRQFPLSGTGILSLSPRDALNPTGDDGPAPTLPTTIDALGFITPTSVMNLQVIAQASRTNDSVPAIDRLAQGWSRTSNTADSFGTNMLPVHSGSAPVSEDGVAFRLDEQPAPVSAPPSQSNPTPANPPRNSNEDAASLESGALSSTTCDSYFADAVEASSPVETGSGLSLLAGGNETETPEPLLAALVSIGLAGYSLARPACGEGRESVAECPERNRNVSV